MAHNLSFTLLSCFTFIKLTTSRACFKYRIKSSKSMGITTGFPVTTPSSICLNPLVVTAILTAPDHLVPYFTAIWVNITSMAVCKYDVTSSFSVLLVFMRNCLCFIDGYYFPSNLISSLSIPYPEEALLGIWLSMWGEYFLGLVVSLTMVTYSSCANSLFTSVYDSWSSSLAFSVI